MARKPDPEKIRSFLGQIHEIQAELAGGLPRERGIERYIDLGFNPAQARKEVDEFLQMIDVFRGLAEERLTRDEGVERLKAIGWREEKAQREVDEVIERRQQRQAFEVIAAALAEGLSRPQLLKRLQRSGVALDKAQEYLELFAELQRRWRELYERQDRGGTDEGDLQL
jgi:hypothetical protein